MTVMVPFAKRTKPSVCKTLPALPTVSKVLAYLSGPDIESLSDWKVRSA